MSQINNPYVFCSTKQGVAYWSAPNKPYEWTMPDVKSKKISKWAWLWNQFLCCLGLRKRPYLIVGIDPASPDGDYSIKVWCEFDEHEGFKVVHMEELNG